VLNLKNDNKNNVKCLAESWIEPQRLVSLLDMLRFYADRFLGMNHALDIMRHKFALHGGVSDVDLTKEFDRNAMVNFMNVLYEMLLDLNLGMSAKQALYIKKRLEYADKIDQEICDATFDLYRRIKDELEVQLILMVPTEKAKFYESPLPFFGEEVIERFPDLVYDMDEAYKCYVFDRSTACVFHLMRVMEGAIQRLGRILEVPNVKEKNWQNIISEIKHAIREKYPNAKDEKRIKYENTLGQLETVKIAWRNPTMHPKVTYTETEAENIINAVKAFMYALMDIV